ncbi:hypothetical protein HDR61_03535 [bacterium]|nr:hypothetical protein [bacterium]
MNKILIIGAFILIPFISHVYAGEHKAGADNSCFYDSNPGKSKWHYYFCGKEPIDKNNKIKCSGKEYKGADRLDGEKPNGDMKKQLMNHEVFTFTTKEEDTYCCCGGTSNTAGRFEKAKNTQNCYTDDKPTEEIKNLGNGKACKMLTYKTVCGDTHTIDCNTPENETCGTGYIWRNNECAPICGGDTVYESEYTNTCIICKTTVYQGIFGDAQNKYCKRCDKDTEFFNRTTKQCIKKSTLMAHSKLAIHECWQCPTTNTQKQCVQAVTNHNTTGTPIPDNIKKICNLT